MAYVTYLKSLFRSNMNIEIKGLIPWGIFTNSITLLHLSCWEFLVNHSPISDELWILKMHDGIIKLQKQEKKKRKIETLGWKPPNRGGLEQEPEIFWRYSKIPKNGRSTCDNWEKSKKPKMLEFTWNRNPTKGSTSRIWTLQSWNILSRTFKPISVCHDVCGNAMFRI